MDCSRQAEACHTLKFYYCCRSAAHLTSIAYACQAPFVHAGTFVHSIAVGDGIGHDTLGGYIGNLNEQVCRLVSYKYASSQQMLASRFT